MESLRQINADKGILRWGGLAGLLGGALMLFVFVFVGVVVGPEPVGPEGPVARFPDISAARTFENVLYLAVIALWAVLVAALYRVLRATSAAPALSGGVLGLVGLAVLAAGALPHVATSRLSDRYHAPGATSVDRQTVALLWEANQGIFDALLAAGLLLLLIGLVALGVAMLRAPAYGRRYAGATLALGLIGVGAASAFVLDPRSPLVAVGLMAMIVASLVLGWKTYRLSNAPGVERADRTELSLADGALAS
jgi:hypothetical protein